MTTDTRPRCLLIDAPWLERGGGKIKRGADRHYPLMGLSDIAKTILRAAWPDSTVVFNPAESAHLWCWTTDNYLLDALSLIDRLGFRYIRTIAWIKVRNHKTDGLASTVQISDEKVIDWMREMLQIGLGQYCRGSHELLLFSTRGKAMVPAPENRPPSVIFAPRTKHSQKPDESYELIERVSPGPRLEMFGRRARSGWRCWGAEAPEEAP